MEQRFSRVWRDIESRMDKGESLAVIIRKAPTRALVAALAAAPLDNPVAANAIATELLNRERRAPYFGAFLVGITILVLHITLDALYTGTPFILESGTRGYILQAGLVTTIAFSAVAFSMWRGRFRRLRMLLARDDGDSF